MEPSPLTQVSRPETFKPKIVGLYEALFKVRSAAPRHCLTTHKELLLSAPAIAGRR